MNMDEVALLLRDLPEPLLLVTPDNRIALANRAAAETLGERLVGQLAQAAIRQPEAVAALERGLRGTPGSPPAEARFVQTAAGAETVFRMVATPLDPGTKLEGVLISFHDISHVEEAEQMRRDFVANVSHELRSPLTVLAGFIETLRHAARDDMAAREKFLEIMEQEAGRMTRLVSDLLSLSRVESSERVRPREILDLGALIQTTLAALRQQIEDGAITVNFDTATGADYRVIGDRDQLTQVFHNLIENAMKYGASGGTVSIEIREHARLPGFSGPVIAVGVIDRGEGIDPIHIPRLTERFYRVDAHRSREMGGTGLGLAIVKHILNRHRGRLTIQSARGEGSTFTVLLPDARENRNPR